LRPRQVALLRGVPMMPPRRRSSSVDGDFAFLSCRREVGQDSTTEPSGTNASFKEMAINDATRAIEKNHYPRILDRGGLARPVA
jgi:hypothetical protein